MPTVTTRTAKTKKIWKELVNTLKAEMGRGKKLSYVKELCEGIRKDMPVFPCIILEPITEIESQHTIPGYKRILLRVNITCWTEVINYETQITGEDKQGDDPDAKGIFDLVADVKDIINANINLNNTCILQRFLSVDYSFENYPYRAGNIEVEFEFITLKDGRMEEKEVEEP